MGETLHIQLPDAPEGPPDLTPVVGQLRERVATLEERTSNLDQSASAESLHLASEAHRLAVAANEKVDQLLSAAAHAPAQAENLAQEVAETLPPPEIHTPAEPEQPADPAQSESHERHLPWWNPLRYIA